MHSICSRPHLHRKQTHIPLRTSTLTPCTHTTNTPIWNRVLQQMPSLAPTFVTAPASQSHPPSLLTPPIYLYDPIQVMPSLNRVLQQMRYFSTHLRDSTRTTPPSLLTPPTNPYITSQHPYAYPHPSLHPPHTPTTPHTPIQVMPTVN